MSQAGAKASNRKSLGCAGSSAPDETSRERERGSFAGRTEASAAAIIDLPHLTRMTFGEKGLEAEVLALFDRQAGMLLARIQQAPPQAAAFAHTLSGSARGVGAWTVAAAAEQLELAAKDADPAATAGALRRLTGAIREARVAIGEMLAAARPPPTKRGA